MQKMTPKLMLNKYGTYIHKQYHNVVLSLDNEQLTKLRKLISLTKHRYKKLVLERPWVTERGMLSAKLTKFFEINN